MHEVFFSRKDVQGCSEDVQAAIHSLLNCIAGCPECHTGEASLTTPEGKKKCADVIVNEVGLQRVINFVTLISLNIKSDRAKEELQWLKTIYQS